MADAFQDTSLADRISVRTIDRISHMTLMEPLMNRDFQEEAQGVEKIRVPVFRSQKEWDHTKGATPDPDMDITTGDFELTSAWPTPGNDGLTYEDLEIDREVLKGWFTPIKAVDQLPRDPTEQASRVLASQLAHGIDQDLINDFITEVSAVSGVPEDAGTDDNYINENGKAQGTGMPEQLYDWIREFSMHADTTGFGIDADGVAPLKWMIFPPACYRAFEDWLLDKNLNSAGQLNLDLLQGRLNRAGLSAAQRIISNVALLISTRVPKVAVASKDHWQILAGTNRAHCFVTQRAQTQLFPAATNPIGDGTSAGMAKRGALVRSGITFGSKMLDTRQARLYRMRASA